MKCPHCLNEMRKRFEFKLDNILEWECPKCGHRDKETMNVQKETGKIPRLEDT